MQEQFLSNSEEEKNQTQPSTEKCSRYPKQMATHFSFIHKVLISV